jgi:ketosteroid isomerase-like protein
MPYVRLRMIKKNLALVMCGLALALAWAGIRAHGDDNSDAVVRDVRAVLNQQAADWNKGDLDAFLTGYWNSPKVVFMSGGQRFDGYEAMRDRYRRRYKAEGKAMGQLAFSELEIESLGPESVFARGRFNLTMPDGTKPTGLFTLIVRKFPDGWKIVHDHTSADETRQASAKAKASRQ